MAELRINFDVRFSPPMFRAVLAALLVSGLAGELSSESVTLTTYYPAPSGVYTQMITTSNTYLARDNGMNSKVGIGNTSPKSKVDISGSLGAGAYAGVTAAPTNGMIISGQVGIGTSIPNASNMLDVNGAIAAGTYAGGAAPANGMVISGRMGIGTSAPSASNMLDVNGAASIGYPGSGAPANGMIVNGSVGIGTSAPPYKLEVIGDIRANGGWLRTTGAAGWYNDTYGGGWYMTDGTWIRNYNGKPLYENSYNEGYSFGATHAGVPMTPLADFDAAGDGVVMLREGWSVGSCFWVNYLTTGITNNICNSPNYVTSIEGVYSSYYHLGIPSGDVGGTQSQALCCSCPTGGCSF